MTERLDSVTLVAALIGFLSGAGLMSHADLLDIYREDFFRFMVFEHPGEVRVYGRDMLYMLTAVLSYLLALACMIGGAVYFAVYERLLPVRLAAFVALLILLSHLTTALYSFSEGYHTFQRALAEHNRHPGQLVRHVWDWR